MAHISPFRALRPSLDAASKLASRPYDVLNSAEAREVVKGNPLSFLHITKPEVDLPETVDVHSTKVYEKGKENLELFIANGILFREEKPCYYIYTLVMNGKSQTGLVCASSLDDYDNDIIKKHEFTRPEKELDRINHMKITGAQTGNVFMAYKSLAVIDAVIESWKSQHNPVYHFTADDAVSHAVWVIDDEEVIEKITNLFAEKIPATYIADGHHRAASAAKVRQSLNGQKAPGADYFLTTLFPSAQLRILDYNRVIKDLNGLTTDEFLAALQKDFMVGKVDQAFQPQQLHEFGLYLEGNWYKLVSKANTWTEDPIGILDVTILQENVLDKILAIKDQRTDTRIDFVGGIRGMAELERRVNSGEMKLAFSIYPVSIEQLFAIADSGNVMPPKSTWFEPKLRDGLLTKLIYS